MFDKSKSSLGQSLIEVLAALAIILLVIVALIRATTISMKSSDFSKTQVLATSYAQEAIEWVRAERDRDWDNIADRAGSTFCLNSESLSDWPSSSLCSGDEEYGLAGRFKREVTLTAVGGEGNRVEVKVILSWQDASGEHQSQLTTYLSNWR
jgi:Tfp pilus assembly protein PilV